MNTYLAHLHDLAVILAGTSYFTVGEAAHHFLTSSTPWLTVHCNEVMRSDLTSATAVLFQTSKWTCESSKQFLLLTATSNKHAFVSFVSE